MSDCRRRVELGKLNCTTVEPLLVTSPPTVLNIVVEGGSLLPCLMLALIMVAFVMLFDAPLSNRASDALLSCRICTLMHSGANCLLALSQAS